MKKTCLAVVSLLLPLVVSAAPETYQLDPYHTYPHFAVDHLGVSTMWGRFDKASGSFVIDRAARAGSVEIVVATASLSTGDVEKGDRPRARDEHLRAADFFNVAEFPRMSFKSTAVRFSGDNPSEIRGQLTLLGVTRPLTLTIDRWVCKDHPYARKHMCGGNASGRIKRSDFGMKFGIPAIGDEVRLFLEFEGYRE
jgi:polyisoprenoid-binding protein YceI